MGRSFWRSGHGAELRSFRRTGIFRPGEHAVPAISQPGSPVDGSLLRRISLGEAPTPPWTFGRSSQLSRFVPDDLSGAAALRTAPGGKKTPPAIAIRRSRRSYGR